VLRIPIFASYSFLRQDNDHEVRELRGVWRFGIRLTAKSFAAVVDRKVHYDNKEIFRLERESSDAVNSVATTCDSLLKLCVSRSLMASVHNLDCPGSTLVLYVRNRGTYRRILTLAQTIGGCTGEFSDLLWWDCHSGWEGHCVASGKRRKSKLKARDVFERAISRFAWANFISFRT
jgi:hypothetical protein